MTQYTVKKIAEFSSKNVSEDLLIHLAEQVDIFEENNIFIKHFKVSPNDDYTEITFTIQDLDTKNNDKLITSLIDSFDSNIVKFNQDTIGIIEIVSAMKEAHSDGFDDLTVWV